MQDMRKLLGMKLKCGWTEAKGKKKEKKKKQLFREKWGKQRATVKMKQNECFYKDKNK